MASNWSARASNMVLMSSRMCLVDGPVGLHQGKENLDEVGKWVCSPPTGVTVLPLQMSSELRGKELPKSVCPLRDS